MSDIARLCVTGAHRHRGMTRAQRRSPWGRVTWRRRKRQVHLNEAYSVQCSTARWRQGGQVNVLCASPSWTACRGCCLSQMNSWTWHMNQSWWRLQTAERPAAPLRARTPLAPRWTFCRCAFFCAGTPHRRTCTRCGDWASSNCPSPKVWTGRGALWESSHLETSCVEQSSSSRCSCLWRKETFALDSRLFQPKSDVQRGSPG